MKCNLMPFLLLFIPLLGQSQTDTIDLFGTVFNQHTYRPEPYCRVSLLQDCVAKATAVCDVEGRFVFDDLPVGDYQVAVSLGAITLYQQSVELYETVVLNIYVDTLQFIELAPVSVRDHRPVPHKLGQLRISSPDDGRLWNFSGNMTLSGPASKGILSSYHPRSFLRERTVPIWYYEFWSYWPKRKRKSASVAPADTSSTRQQ